MLQRGSLCHSPCRGNWLGVGADSWLKRLDLPSVKPRLLAGAVGQHGEGTSLLWAATTKALHQ